MKELIAFIVMALVIAVLIEFNERRKKKRNQESGVRSQDCPDTACTDCSLLDICDKDKKTNI